jgi:hypothetical protein
MLPVEIFIGILIFKGFTARRLYKWFGVKGFRKIYLVSNIFFSAVTRIPVERII